jgi:hypothetical protein
MKITLALCLVTSLLLGGSRPDIMPIPGSQRLKPVFDSSDVVCFCVVQSVDITEGPIPQNSPGRSVLWTRRIRFVAQVRDSYREANTANEPLVVQVEDNAPAASKTNSPFKPGRGFLLFLKSTPAGFYVLADTFLGATPFNSIPRQGTADGFDKLQDVLSAIAIGPNEDDEIRALHLLQGFDSLGQRTIQIAQSLTNATNPEVAVTAIALLLNTKTLNSLQALAAFLQRYQGDYHSWGFINIDSSLAQFRDPDTLPILETLSHSRSVSVRDGAIRALRGIRSPEAVQVLVERSDDADQTIRYLAVITLAETLGKYDGDFAPSMYLFDKNPEYYTGLWKQWWRDVGSKGYPRKDPPAR